MISARSLTSGPAFAAPASRPYRWRGKPDWDPAAEADRRERAMLATTCGYCHVPAGQWCNQRDGQRSEYLHAARKQAA